MAPIPQSDRRVSAGPPGTPVPGWVLSAHETVTDREREVLQLFAFGYSLGDVAGQMVISEKTVKNHLAAVYPKLQARSRTEALVRALCAGLVRLPHDLSELAPGSDAREFPTRGDRVDRHPSPTMEALP
jgi:DNA-binding CsgD family transcriptional regulator